MGQEARKRIGEVKIKTYILKNDSTLLRLEEATLELSPCRRMRPRVECVLNWASPKAKNARNWFWFTGPVAALGKRTKLI
jgi:hypothetical protein